ncbi:MAG: hypothetical protein KJ638_08325 [Chloroflexi bacterium]|nr:hypothetical protein [Chloroflexota bacterium]
MGRGSDIFVYGQICQKGFDFPAAHLLGMALIMDAVDDDDVEGRQELHNLSRESLTVTRSTAHVLQSVLAAALVFVSMTTNWRL